MASSSTVNGNLVDELEEAFQSCIHALTKEESATGVDKDEIKLEVDQTTLKFIDLARQMEAFFLQKRFLLSALKPDLLLKEENFDLRQEISRKDELIRKHYDKIETWKALLADQQQPGYNKSMQGAAGSTGMPTDLRSALTTGPPGGPMNMPGLNNPMQNPIQHQQHMQQQQMMQAQQMQQQIPPMPVGNQQMFMQTPGPRGAFNQSPNVLQGPLHYLEKTTSNIEHSSETEKKSKIKYNRKKKT
uniref:Mediator of RNA polymerase II transcription subunit 28 n=1 Tax=Corethrella appendiculata TaxID=1370023 RepID=U5EP56_9DIPT